ncbi:hypothetical protein OROGR_023328 [Orobanche gracilis]
MNVLRFKRLKRSAIGAPRSKRKRQSATDAGRSKRRKGYAPAEEEKVWLAEEEKVCFVCKMFGHGSDYYFFVGDLSEGNTVQCLEPLVRLKSEKLLSICGIDSTVFMVEPSRREYLSPVIKPDPIYYLDLDPNKQKSLHLNLRSGDVKKLPPMSEDKENAVITRVPNSKRFLVFSSYILFAERENNLGDDIYKDVVAATDDPSTGAMVDFEMHDVGKGSWIRIPQFFLRIAQKSRRKDPTVLQLYDPFARSWNKLRELRIEEDQRDKSRITRFTFIDDTTLVVAIDLGFLLKLDLASLHQGWKVYEKGGNGKVFVISGSLNDTWCASDVKVPEKMYSQAEEYVELPLSSFHVATEEIHTCVNPLERKDHVCALQTALRMKNEYPQMVIDVVDVGGGDDEKVKHVATFRGQFKRDFVSVYPIYMFQYHQPQSSSHQLEDQLQLAARIISRINSNSHQLADQLRLAARIISRINPSSDQLLLASTQGSTPDRINSNSGQLEDQLQLTSTQLEDQL